MLKDDLIKIGRKALEESFDDLNKIHDISIDIPYYSEEECLKKGKEVIETQHHFYEEYDKQLKEEWKKMTPVERRYKKAKRELESEWG